MNPDRLLARMSGRQFTAWQIYEALEPFGERGHYWRTGQLCAAIFNSQRAKKTDPIAKAEDYMPKTFTHEEEDETANTVDEFARMKALQESVRRPHG